MRVTHGFMGFGLATIIALAGLGAGPAPVAATDPTPAPTAAPSQTADPTPAASPDPSPSPSATADPSAPADPAASTDPAASATTAPTSVAVAAVATTTTAPRPSKGLLVRRIALSQIHDAYVRGGVGPNVFDCSGLVRYAYRKAGVSAKLGGGHSARAMLYWGRIHHKTSRSNPRIGDVAIYGNGRHAGIYIGNGRIISALNPRLDIRITRLHALNDAFTTFIHTGI